MVCLLCSFECMVYSFSLVDYFQELFTSVLVVPLPQTFKSTKIDVRENKLLPFPSWPLKHQKHKTRIAVHLFFPSTRADPPQTQAFETNNLQICKFFVPPFSKSFRIFNFFKKRNPPSNFRRFWCPFLTYCQNSFSATRFR